MSHTYGSLCSTHKTTIITDGLCPEPDCPGFHGYTYVDCYERCPKYDQRQVERQNWIVTFGHKYPREEHPTFPEAHHDGYITIEDVTSQEAMDIAHERLGRNWSMVREATPETLEWFPLGELARWTRNPDLSSPHESDDTTPDTRSHDP